MKITLTPEDIVKGEPFQPGWYKVEIVAGFAKPSKDSQSVNYVFEYKLENDPMNRVIGEPGNGSFSSKAITMIKPFLAALGGVSLAEFIEKTKATGVTFDIEECIGKKLQIKIENELYEGRMKSKVKDFATYDFKIPF